MDISWYPLACFSNAARTPSNICPLTMPFFDSAAVRATASTGSRYSAATVKSTPSDSASAAILPTSGNAGCEADDACVGYAAAAGFDPIRGLSSMTYGARSLMPLSFLRASLMPRLESSSFSRPARDARTLR